MKVLISTGLIYPSKLGGPSNTLYWLSKGLIARGIDVSVVSMYKYIDDKRIVPDKWIDFEGLHARYCSNHAKFPFEVVWYSIRVLRKNDILILSSFFYLPCFIVGLFGLFFKKKVIWSPRGELFSSAINGNKGKLLYLKFIKFLFGKKFIFHVTSSEEKLMVEKYLGKNARIVILPNYMELPIKEPREKKNPYLLYVGRIAPIKALGNLIRSLSKSKYFLDSDYKLLIAGDGQGEYYNSLLTLIKEDEMLSQKVVFLGNVEGKEKNKLYANAYFTFLISHSENFGNVVIESIAQGTPVVTSCGTPWQILEKTNSGFWIDNEEDNIAQCIDKILKLPVEEYELMRNNAFNLCRNNFDIYENIDKWIEVIN